MSRSDQTRTKIEPRVEPGGVVIRLEGPINEHFDRLRFVSSSTGRIVIVDLDGVPWITSFGVREWVHAIQEMPKTYLGFINVRPIMVQQFNMVAAFAGDGELLSFYAPYTCPHCNHSQESLIDLIELHPKVKQLELPPILCEACHNETELDELAENYLSYVASARPPDPPAGYTAVLRGEPATPVTTMPLRIGKVVEGTVTMLMLAGELDRRVSLKRALAGLEGTVAVSLSGVQTHEPDSVSPLHPLWEGTGPEILLVETPLALAQALPEEAWRRLKIFSLQTELKCVNGHTLKRARLQNDEIWRLIRGDEPLRCLSCHAPLVAEGLDVLAARNVFAAPSPQTIRSVTQLLDRVHSPNSDAMPAEQFGRYELLEQLGLGGMAEVFRARKAGFAGFEKTVVLKRILPHLSRDERFIEMFLQEARLAARISHTNVVQIYDIGQTDQRHYIVMEHVQGWDLSRLLAFATRLDRPFPLHIAAQICVDIASALDAAHNALGPHGELAPIIHRDVSPHNVLISRDGAVKLTDFGIAKALENGAMTPTGTLKGKLAYLAPEVALGASAIDVRADLFPVGIILYQLITLGTLFRRSSDYATIHALLHEPILPLRQLRPDIPDVLNGIGLRALARDPAQRYQSAQQLRRDLEIFIHMTGMSTSSSVVATYVCQLADDAAHLRGVEPDNVITVDYTHRDLGRDHR